MCLPERMFSGDVSGKGKAIQHVEPLNSFYTVTVFPTLSALCRTQQN